MHQEKRLTQKRQTEEGLNHLETHIEALMHDASAACAAASIKHQTDKKLLSQYAAMHLNDGSPLSQPYILSQAQELQVQQRRLFMRRGRTEMEATTARFSTLSISQTSRQMK